MIDFNTILSAAITASINTAIEQAVAPLKEQIAALQDTVTRMEGNAAAQNSEIKEQIDPTLIADVMNNQEWFWAKISDYVESSIGNIDFSEAISDAFSNSSIVEEAVEQYITDYDFTDNIESHIESQLNDYDFKSIVSDILDDARITL